LRLLRKEERNKQGRGRKGKQANQKASKQTLPHVLGFGRYLLSHKPSRPSKKEKKKTREKSRSRLNPNYPRFTHGRGLYPFPPTNVSHYKQAKEGEKWRKTLGN
jgi:hypothetical protein